MHTRHGNESKQISDPPASLYLQMKLFSKLSVPFCICGWWGHKAGPQSAKEKAQLVFALGKGLLLGQTCVHPLCPACLITTKDAIDEESCCLKLNFLGAYT